MRYALAEVLGIENAERNMPVIVERALDLALEKRDPKQKLERRRKREAAAATRRKTSPEKVSTEEKKRPEAAGSRYIPSSVRERVLERAGYQCEFKGTGGVRCTARAGLEIDHIKPYGKGGATRGEENLRALCQGHNLFSAAQEFGEDFMKGKIEGRVENPSCLLCSP